MAYDKVYAKVTFKGDYGKPPNHLKPTSFPSLLWAEVTDGDFQSGLAAFTDCNIAQVNILYTFNGDNDPPESEANVDRTLIIKLRANATAKVTTITIPAPKDSIIEDSPKGQKLTEAAKNQFMTFVYNNFSTGYTYLYSYVTQSR